LKPITFTEYFEDKIKIRNIPADGVRKILQGSNERYYDTETGRLVKIGRTRIKNLNLSLAIIYEENDEIIVVTAHTVSRNQINTRIKNKRWIVI
jgi:hypothetical protein